MSSEPSNEDIKNLIHLFQSGNLLEAKGLAEQQITSYPKSIWGWKVLGAIYGGKGNLTEALKINTKVVELSPNDPESYNNLGVTLQELGRIKEAEENYKKAIKIKPDFAEACFNLGNIFMETESFDDAIEIYRRTININPQFTIAHYNLGNVLFEQKKLEEAEASFRKATMIDPKYTDAYVNLGQTLSDLKKFDQAEKALRKAIVLSNNDPEIIYKLGGMLHKLGKYSAAEETYRQVIAIKPDFLSARHMLAALTGETKPSAPRDYVERLFDKYASNFENDLINNLEYKIPKLITETILKYSNSKSLGTMVDLGCGTGLFGSEVKHKVENLVGVDLSVRMLDVARKKNVYHELINEDILTYLSESILNFDYFVSTDVFIYVGDLSEVFRLIKLCNKKTGKLVFSTEHLEGEGYMLEKSGRYSHSKKYIEGLSEEFGFKLIECQIVFLRKDGNQTINGALYLLEF